MKNRANPSYVKLNNRFKEINLNDNYYKKYYNRIIANKEKYYNCCLNSLFNFQYFNEKYGEKYKNSFNSMIEKISKKEKLTTGLEKEQFIQCVALSMNDGGIL